MKVNSNMQAMIAQGILHNNEKRFQKATEKLSSGYKINTAIDNPSGMAITNKMYAQLRSLNKANQNTNNGISVCQIADGAYSEIEAMLQRMNELAVKSSNGTLTTEDRTAIDTEVKQLSKEIERIGKNTEYNTQSIFDGSLDLKGYTSSLDTKVRSYNPSFPAEKGYKITVNNGSATIKDANDKDVPIKGQPKTETFYKIDKTTGKETTEVDYVKTTFTTYDGGELIIDTKASDLGSEITVDLEQVGGMKIQTGSAEHQDIQVVIPEVSLLHLGIGNMDGELSISMRTQEDSKKAISKITEAISYISASRSKVGAYQNRLEATASNLEVSEENLTNSYSTIKDLDMAEEMVNYTTLQVLVQAGTTMLTQANEEPQQALQLLQ